MPRVSVLMPVHDAEVFLATAIASVLAQTFTDHELVVALDRSTDRSEEIARGFADSDARVVVIASPDAGLPATLNAAAGAARAPLLARLDADDEAMPDRLSAEVGYLDANPDVAMVGAPAVVVAGAGSAVGRIKVPSGERAIRLALTRRNPFVHSSVAMRAAVFRAAGGYRDDFPFVEDYDLWLRMAGHGRLANLTTPLVRYRRHGEGVSTRNAARQRRNRLRCFVAWQRDAGLIDRPSGDGLLADIDACFARLDALADAPATFTGDDLVLFRRVLPRVGSGDTRALIGAVAAAAKAGAIGGVALAAFRLRAAASRIGFERTCRMAAGRLVPAAPGR